MEAMQDKQIREKLNSLDTLPEGYTPSLDSKWELLMAGQPQKKERPVYMWYAAAASFLILLTFSFLFLKSTEQPATEIIAEAPVLGKSLKPISQENHQIGHQKSVAENARVNQPKTAIAANSVTRFVPENASHKALKTQVSENSDEKIAAALSSENNILKAEPETTITEQTPNLIAAEAPKSIQKKKARFIELDFDTPAKPQMAATALAQTAKVKFKIKILPKASEDAPAIVQNEKPLRLQHTF